MQAVAAQRTVGVCTVIEGLADPGNVSAVCRTADALGFLSVHVISRQGGKGKGQQQQETQEEQDNTSSMAAGCSQSAGEGSGDGEASGGKQAVGSSGGGGDWLPHNALSEGESEGGSEEGGDSEVDELEDGWSLLKEIEENGPKPMSARKRRRARRSATSFRQSPRVVAGADKWLHVSTWKDTSACLMDLKEKGYRIAVTVLSPETVSGWCGRWRTAGR